MRRTLWLLLTFAAFAQAAHAADEESLREARALLDSMHIDAQFQAMGSAMGQGMMREMGGTAASQRVAEIMMSTSIAVMRERALQPGGLIDLAASAYAENFTVDELRELRRFYESPVGRKMLAKTPEVMGRVMQQSVRMAREAAPIVCGRAKARMEAEGLETEAGRMKCDAMASARRPAAPPQGGR